LEVRILSGAPVIVNDERWMQLALQWACRAAGIGEVPVGAVVVGPDGSLVAAAHNLRETRSDPSAHAEVVAIRRAARQRGDWQLRGHRLYVTLEPCPMCVGVALAARMGCIVYGAASPESGAIDSVLPLADFPGLQQRCESRGGVLERECQQVLLSFFAQQRA
jgi:tRNA(adenine34) deaminase